ncbi:MAG: hypothetical protein GF411_14160 [Candidatus Lokiarchaeota archaeon]|nr:hypothetical protein [Candidatus Lokiarchaeota archaeon]
MHRYIQIYKHKSKSRPVRHKQNEIRIIFSFIVPYRDRQEMIPGLIKNINKYYNNYEILIIEQRNNKPFMRGQLCNLGYQRSIGKYVIFMDVDARFLYKIDLVPKDRPMVMFTTVVQVKEDGDKLIPLSESRRLSGFGLCTAFSRKQFEESNGFSNLPIGWGCEDNILHKRANLIRMPHKMGHVWHGNIGWRGKTTKKALANNRKILNAERNKDTSHDSYKHTTGVNEIKNVAHQYDYNRYIIYSFEDIEVNK